MIFLNFDLISFLRAVCVPIITFIWSGTWSLVHMPYYFYLPFFLFVLILSNIKIPKNFIYFSSIKTFFLICLALIFMGLVGHILVTFGIEQVPTSPGWYLHILMPGFAIILGAKIYYYLNSMQKIPFYFKLKISYFLIFPFLIFCLNALLFSGFVIKSPLKKYALINNDIYYLVNNVEKMYSNLSLISYPLLGLTFMIMGYIFFGYVVYKFVNLKKIN